MNFPPNGRLLLRHLNYDTPCPSAVTAPPVVTAPQLSRPRWSRLGGDGGSHVVEREALVSRDGLAGVVVVPGGE